MKNFTLVLLSATLILASSLLADFHQESMSEMKFHGGLGTMMKFMGMNKPTYSATYLKGNVLRTDELDKKGEKAESSQIIDLDRELFITVDHKKKKYTQITFAEWKAQMEEMMGNFKSAMEQPAGAESAEGEPEKPDVKMDFKLDVSKTGEKQKIAGLNAEEVIIKITIEGEATQTETAEGESPASAKGGMIVTSTEWKASEVDPDGELSAFYQKLAEKIGMMPPQMDMQKMFDQLKKSNPQLGEAIGKMQAESEKMKGLSVKSHTVYETYGESSEQKDGEVEEEEVPTSIGGMFGKLGKKMVKKNEKEAGENNVLMESFSEVLRFDRGTVGGDVFDIPAKYKEEKAKRR